jgi:hypothetical protein
MLGGTSYLASQFLHPEHLRWRNDGAPKQETRRYSRSDIRKLAKAIEKDGFPGSAVLDDQDYVVAGWNLVLAALHLGWDVPVKRLFDPLATERLPISIYSYPKRSIP